MLERAKAFIKRFIEDERGCCPACKESKNCESYTKTEEKLSVVEKSGGLVYESDEVLNCCRECKEYKMGIFEYIECPTVFDPTKKIKRLADTVNFPINRYKKKEKDKEREKAEAQRIKDEERLKEYSEFMKNLHSDNPYGCEKMAELGCHSCPEACTTISYTDPDTD